MKFEDDGVEVLMNFVEEGKTQFSFESPPSAMNRVPYWQLRAISTSIKSGGFLSPALYVPRMVWLQPGAKFSALSMKQGAFEHIMSLTDKHIAPLLLQSDLANLNATSGAFAQLVTELGMIQNDLAKPFNFISEVPIVETLRSPTKTRVGQFTSMFSAVTKNVRKYAEVGYNRLGALSTRASTTEITLYYSSITNLCEGCQVSMFFSAFAPFITVDILFP